MNIYIGGRGIEISSERVLIFDLKGFSAKRNYSASFIINSTKYWRGTTLCFKGNSAQLFYEVLKFKKLDWTVFDLDSTNLGRFVKQSIGHRKMDTTSSYVEKLSDQERQKRTEMY